MVEQEADEPTRLLYLPVVLHAVGRYADADEAIKAQIAQWSDDAAFYIAETYAYRGDHDLAMEWLQRAYAQKDLALNEIVADPLFSSMADDPRFKAFLRKMKLPERTALGRHADSDAAIRELIRKYERLMSIDIAYVFAFRGDSDRAFE